MIKVREVKMVKEVKRIFYIFIIQFSLAPPIVQHGRHLETQTQQGSILHLNTNTTIFEQHFSGDNAIHCLQNMNYLQRDSGSNIARK